MRQTILSDESGSLDAIDLDELRWNRGCETPPEDDANEIFLELEFDHG